MFMNVKHRRLLTGLITSTPLLATLAASPAYAQDTGAVRSTPSTIHKADVQPSDTCSIHVGDYDGIYKCGTDSVYQWRDGHLELFVIGTDGTLYHIWQTYVGDRHWSGWYNLGGHDLQDSAIVNDVPTIG